VTNLSYKLENSLYRLKTLSEYRFSSDISLDRIRVKLDANENWHIPEEALRGLVSKAMKQVDVRKYPLRIVEELRAAIAKHLRIPAESIIPTQGSDQGIDLLCQVFLRQEDRALIVGPTYAYYELRAAIAEAQCVQVSMNEDLSLPVESVLSQGKDAAVVFVCSPNNPTGNQFSASDIMRLCDGFSGLVVLDEAYVDFAQESLVREVLHRRNLAVLRTFSKAFGLANLRLGFIIANPEWASFFLNRVQYPYPVSSLIASIASQLLQEFELIENGLKSLRNERTRLLEELRKIKGVEALDSQANFILANLPIEAGKAHRQLLERGIATKEVGQVLNLPNCIRVTVGTREMNLSFLESLSKVLNYA
jgi:histidinol-phosphate aminotransferase